jgi:hypothetical protein
VDEKQPLRFDLKADVLVRRIFCACLAFELLIVFLDVFVNHYEWSSIGSIRRMVNITREDSLSNWFSSFQLITVGLVLWVTALSVRKRGHGAKKFYGWAVLGSFFTYMGIDDAIKFHERIGTAFRRVLEDAEESSGAGILNHLHDAFPSYSWQVVFGPFFLAMGVFLLWFLWRELSAKRLRYWLLAALSLYTVAVGLDFVEGLDSDPYEGTADYFSTTEDRVTHMSKAVEEFFEMFGTTIFLTVFLANVFSLSRRWEIDVVHAAENP